MRIISGKHKGRKLVAPKNLPVRPTTDMAKEALFNIINNHFYFDEIELIDLFAGTGNISYEFASRGTEVIYSVDNHQGCTKFIHQTSAALNLNIQTIKSDVYTFLGKTQLKADIIFADPPYDFAVEEFVMIADVVFERALLNEEGLLIIEHSKHTDLSMHSHFSYSKKYGGNLFSFFENK